jgi:5-methylcytosine-specific restriction endonuclease McrA
VDNLSVAGDRRYGSTSWKRLRREILLRDNGFCQIQGPRCSGRATTVDHIVPASQAPALFWDPENLRGACGACNSGRVSRMQADRVADLEAIVAQQQAMIEHLLEQLSAYANGAPARARPDPRIF